MREILLDIRDLTTSFTSDGVRTIAVDNVSYHVLSGETVGIVGESGSGKSVTSLSVLGLVEKPAGNIDTGTILFEGKNLLDLSEREMQKIRGKEISMIFQEPTTSLNPTQTCGTQIAEAIMLHQKKSHAEAWKQAVDMLTLVGIPLPEQRAKEYPHQLSGGMRQRVMIAIALSCNPKLLIADEPTTALDVTIQAQILKLMRTLKDQFGMSIMLITHDLGVVAEMCERIIVMYLGKIVEEATATELFKNPKHPYTLGLMKSIPTLSTAKGKLYTIEGAIATSDNRPDGCGFHPRCPYALEICKSKSPDMIHIENGHRYACHLEGGVTGQMTREV